MSNKDQRGLSIPCDVQSWLRQSISEDNSLMYAGKLVGPLHVQHEEATRRRKWWFSMAEKQREGQDCFGQLLSPPSLSSYIIWGVIFYWDIPVLVSHTSWIYAYAIHVNNIQKGWGKAQSLSSAHQRWDRKWCKTSQIRKSDQCLLLQGQQAQ